MKDKSSSFNWRDLALAASLGISGVLIAKVFFGSNGHGNNGGNGHAPRMRNGGGRHPPMLPPQYDYQMAPPGAIPYGPPPQQMRRQMMMPQQQLPPGYRQVAAPPQQEPQYYEPTPGSQNTVGRAVLSQPDYGAPEQGMMVHDRRGVRMAGGGE